MARGARHTYELKSEGHHLVLSGNHGWLLHRSRVKGHQSGIPDFVTDPQKCWVWWERSGKVDERRRNKDPEKAH